MCYGYPNYQMYKIQYLKLYNTENEKTIYICICICEGAVIWYKKR